MKRLTGRVVLVVPLRFWHVVYAFVSLLAAVWAIVAARWARG